MSILISVISLLGPLSIIGALIVLARLSRRLGRVTRSRPYYRALYIASGFVWLHLAIRVLDILGVISITEDLGSDSLWNLLYNGLSAIGLTVGIFVAWRYWSWLLAERD